MEVSMARNIASAYASSLDSRPFKHVVPILKDKQAVVSGDRMVISLPETNFELADLSEAEFVDILDGLMKDLEKEITSTLRFFYRPYEIVLVPQVNNSTHGMSFVFHDNGQGTVNVTMVLRPFRIPTQDPEIKEEPEVATEVTQTLVCDMKPGTVFRPAKGMNNNYHECQFLKMVEPMGGMHPEGFEVTFDPKTVGTVERYPLGGPNTLTTHTFYYDKPINLPQVLELVIGYASLSYRCLPQELPLRWKFDKLGVKLLAEASEGGLEHYIHGLGMSGLEGDQNVGAFHLLHLDRTDEQPPLIRILPLPAETQIVEEPGQPTQERIEPRLLTDHRVNGANDQIEILVNDQPGAGGANHRYEITGFDTATNASKEDPRGYSSSYSRLVLLFQNGAIKECGVNGITHEALLAILIDRMEGFQKGNYACHDNQMALDHLQSARLWLQKRTLDRLARGVEGKHKK